MDAETYLRALSAAEDDEYIRTHFSDEIEELEAPDASNEPILLTTAQVRDRLGVTRQRVDQMIRRGDLGAQKVGFGSRGLLLVDGDDVERWASSHGMAVA